MKIGVIGDIHWSKYSSIMRQIGETYTKRLENCIESINWAEETLKDCDEIVYLGDFFDSSDLSNEEITALTSIKWNDKPHRFLVGNHEMGINDLSKSSAHIFKLFGFDVIDKPKEVDGIGYIPYVLSANREPLNNYVGNCKIIFSHNDIKGVQMGRYVSEDGFSIEEIEKSCEMFINGHLHNGERINDRIINLGNLTGQNFSEDANRYSHKIAVIDSDSCELTFYENPHAFNFYKVDYNSGGTELKTNAIVTASVNSDKQQEVKDFLENDKNVICYRMVVNHLTEDSISSGVEQLSVDHIGEFYNYVIDKLGNSDIVRKELEEVLK